MYVAVLYFIFFLAIIDISHTPRVNKIHVCVGGSKADSIIACIGMDAYEDTLKRKGGAPDNHERSSDQRLYRPRQREAKGLEEVDRAGAET